MTKSTFLDNSITSFGEFAVTCQVTIKMRLSNVAQLFARHIGPIEWNIF